MLIGLKKCLYKQCIVKCKHAWVLKIEKSTIRDTVSFFH